MGRKAEPRVIDFGRSGDWGHRVFVNSLPAQADHAPRPLVDVTNVDGEVLRHLRTVARRIKDQDGFKSQFVAVTEPLHRHLRSDPTAVLGHVWHEAFGRVAMSAALKKDGNPGGFGERKTSWTIDELWDTEFPDLDFLVDSLIPQGGRYWSLLRRSASRIGLPR